MIHGTFIVQSKYVKNIFLKIFVFYSVLGVS